MNDLTNEQLAVLARIIASPVPIRLLTDKGVATCEELAEAGYLRRASSSIDGDAPFGVIRVTHLYDATPEGRAIAKRQTVA